MGVARGGTQQADYTRPPRPVVGPYRLPSTTMRSSEIHVRLGVFVALRGALVVLSTRDGLVANVAVLTGALLACKCVLSSPLLVNFRAVRAERAKSDVDSWVILKTQELLDHLGRDFWRQ